MDLVYTCNNMLINIKNMLPTLSTLLHVHVGVVKNSLHIWYNVIKLILLLMQVHNSLCHVQTALTYTSQGSNQKCQRSQKINYSGSAHVYYLNETSYM